MVGPALGNVETPHTEEIQGNGFVFLWQVYRGITGRRTRRGGKWDYGSEQYEGRKAESNNHDDGHSSTVHSPFGRTCPVTYAFTPTRVLNQGQPLILARVLNQGQPLILPTIAMMYPLLDSPFLSERNLIASSPLPNCLISSSPATDFTQGDDFGPATEDFPEPKAIANDSNRDKLRSHLSRLGLSLSTQAHEDSEDRHVRRTRARYR